ncbi:chorismate mutase [Ramlibacter sp. H39-3-26]|uniref:chorismate mutase n=1 Tax=Curvibacter soli TaxID=3031331 RepID=UPI0023DA0381|nr:chorismate mutase [Ramlibacter sp. H39-3-26]MDF1486137.1 chorismate mutase [Ramlibacter sp. H39-3-26]
MSQHLSIPMEHCETMADVRRHIDALDDRIVALISERSGYVAQAARIKDSADQVYDGPRIEFIVSRVRAGARSFGAPEDVLEATYRAMVDAFIAFEGRTFERIRAAQSPETPSAGGAA